MVQTRFWSFTVRTESSGEIGSRMLMKSNFLERSKINHGRSECSKMDVPKSSKTTSICEREMEIHTSEKWTFPSIYSSNSPSPRGQR